MNKGQIAKENYSSGMNCAQAVLLAFKDKIDIPEEQLKKIIIGFGGGFGRQRLTCGAVSGMVAVLGLLKSDGENKPASYELVRKACADFIEELGTLSCAELMDGVHKERHRPCAEICEIATNIAEKYL